MARPATLEPNRTLAFNLTDRQIEWVREQAAKRGVSMATIVREALEAFREDQRQKREQS